MVKVCLDAGHYGRYNRSPVNKEYYESEAMWKLHLLQKKYLEKYGIEVKTTRDNQAADRDLYSRGFTAKGCDLFISDHSNASTNQAADRVTVYHLENDTTTNVDDISKVIAAKIAAVVADEMDTVQGWKIASRKSESDRNGDGILNDNYYGVLNGARIAGVPAILIEHSFHTNKRSTDWLLDERNLDRLAKAEAREIARYFGIGEEKEEPKEEPKSELYRVRKSWDNKASQIGAFTHLDGAKGVADQNKGYYVFNEKGEAIYPETAPNTPSVPFKVRVSIPDLHIRADADYKSADRGYIAKGVYTITEVRSGAGSKAGWGRLKSGVGWISLDYATTV